MARWSNTSGPTWVKNGTVSGGSGWYSALTGELLVAMANPKAVPGVAGVINSVRLEGTNQHYRTGDTIIVYVTFSQKIVVTGTPQITIKVNGTSRTANYVAGSGNATLKFAYVVVGGDTATTGQLKCGIAATAAVLTLGTLNAQLAYTAKTAGVAGNSITIAYVNGGASQSLSIGVSGSAITVNLATDGGSVVTSTATLVRAAIIASVPANALVSVGLGSGNGSSLVVAVSATNLATGTDNSVNSLSLNSGTLIDKAAFATLTLGSTNSQVAMTAVKNGLRGNNLTCTIINPGTNNASLVVTVSGYNIKVSLATDGSAVATSTSTLVAAAINSALPTLVVATVGSGNGSGTVVVASKTPFVAGVANVAATPLTYTPTTFSLVAVN